MRDFLTRFRFGDFAAYFLPGLVMLGAISWLLSFSAFGAFVMQVTNQMSFVTGLLVACTAYAIGAFISGSSAKLFPYAYLVTRQERYTDLRSSIQPTEIEEAVRAAFGEVFGAAVSSTLWSECHFYLARSIVNERMGYASAEAVRQNDLYRLRENMLVPLLTLYAATIMSALVDGRGLPMYRWPLVFASTVVMFFATGRLVRRAADNRRREVREIYSALLVGCRLKLFSDRGIGTNTKQIP
jgi:hypothetical protein